MPVTCRFNRNSFSTLTMLVRPRFDILDSALPLKTTGGDCVVIWAACWIENRRRIYT